MTAQAVTGMIAAAGLATIGSAVLTVLADIAMGIGAYVMLMLALFAGAYLLARLDERKHPLTVVIAPMLTEPETVIDDALPLFFKHEKRLRGGGDSIAGSDWDG